MSREILKRKSKETDPLSASVDDIISGIEDKVLNKREVEVIERNGKKILVFNDPLFSREPRSIVNYSIFRGKWEFELLEDIDEADPNKCAVEFTPLNDKAKLIIAFKSVKDRVEFMNSIYTSQEIKQVGGGMSLEKIANSKIMKTTGGLLGLTVAGYGLYKFLRRKKDEA
ncbi:MAG: hypothetical protein ACUVRG_09665 [Ignavibacterium sp.]|uniref:hypothetical protein n=1 Tax=Ignavibacterium sp. TaxID=2651167 RepID=UPI00404B2E4F